MIVNTNPNNIPSHNNLSANDMEIMFNSIKKITETLVNVDEWITATNTRLKLIEDAIIESMKDKVNNFTVVPDIYG